MVLNHEELKKEQLIRDVNIENYDNASYDLSIDTIISVDGRQHSKFNIKPNSMAVVVSKERIVLPSDRIGHASIKTRLSQKGIMANNIGIIDPQYSGHISTVLTNFGKDDFFIEENEIFLRVTISKFKRPKQDIPLGFDPINRESYLYMIKSKTMEYLGSAFINIDKIAGGIENKVTENHLRDAKKKNKEFKMSLIILTLIIGVLTYLVDTISSNIKNDKYDDIEVQMKKMQNSYFLDDLSKEKFRRDIQNLTEMNIYLQQKLDSIDLKINNLVKK